MRFTWNDGILLVHYAYGIDGQLIGTLDPTVTAEERDADRSDAFFVHLDLVLDYFAGICQDKIVKGDLEGSGAVRRRTLSTPFFFFVRVDGIHSRRHLPIDLHLFGRRDGVATGRW